MTSYLTEWSYGQNGNAYFNNLAIAPVTSSIQVIVAAASIISQGTFHVIRYNGGTITGGTTNPSVPMREGSAPASAIVKRNYTSISGTATYIQYGIPTQEYKPFSTMTIAPGNVLAILALTAATIYTAYFYYDEMHLAISN